MTTDSSNKRNITIAIAIVMMFFIILHIFMRDPSDQPIIENTPWALHAAKAKQGTVTEIFPALGRVESSSELTIAPQISGVVLALGPREGGAVKEGDILVQIDTREFIADRDALQAQLTGTRNAAKNIATEYERFLKLNKDGFVAQSKLDVQETAEQTARAAVSALENQVKALDVKISHGNIISPLNASVIHRNAEVGDTVFPGKPIYMLSAHKGGRVIVHLPLSSLIKVKSGGRVELLNGSETSKSTITRVNPSLDKYSMGSLEIDLPSRPFNLPDGSPISANVLTDEINHATIIPEDAIAPSDNPIHWFVFRVRSGEPDKLVKTPVEVKLCGREGCAVTGNINPGDIVARGHGSVLLRLRDGDAVNINWKSE